MTQPEYGNEPTRIISTADEQAEIERRRAEERAARNRSLGVVDHSNEPAAYATPVPKPTTDKALPSLGLFLLRLVTAAIVGIHGFQKLTDIDSTRAFFESLNIPSPLYAAWGTGVAEVLAAVALVFGFATRLAGLGIAAIAIGALAMVKWGKENPFQSGVPGFTGELELLLAGVGLALLFLGAGRWSIDGSIRASRRRNKYGN